MARHRRSVLVVWLVALIGCAALYPSLHDALGAPDYRVQGADSTRAAQLLERYFPSEGSEQDVLVFYSPVLRARDGAFRAVVGHALALMGAQRQVAGVSGPYASAHKAQISADEHAAIAAIGVRGSARELIAQAGHLQSVASEAQSPQVHVWMTGYSPIAKDLMTVESRDIERAEAIGVPVALVILLLAFGAAGAAALPLLLAGAGLLLTYGVLALLSRVFRFDIFLLTIVTMIGVGIGIDYALFIVSRFREELARDRSEDRVARSVAVAIATSGRVVMFSGAIVALSLACLFIVKAPIFQEISVGAVAVVCCTLLAALTLLPATLASLGERVNAGALPAALQPANTRDDREGALGGWARWAQTVMRHPLIAAASSAAILIAIAIPVLGLRTGVNLDFSSLSGSPAASAEQVLARSFTPGALSPIEVLVVPQRGHPLGHLSSSRERRLAGEISKDTRVAGLSVRQERGSILVSIVPSVAIDSPAASALVERLRHELAPRIRTLTGATVLVGGTTAQFVDLSHETHDKFPVVLALVLGLSVLLLLVVFRSVVLPIKAALMNLLATAATIGLVVLVFQDGHGAGVLQFSSPGFIQVYLPLSVFALLFGLSMDYEVFLIGRMREAWRETHENRQAVSSGLQHTGRPISAAAAIMVAVFGSFVTANVLEIKQFGFALAVAVALDATLVRLVLVPALMRLLGSVNWWWPVPSRKAAEAEPEA
jgi:RND superfamily putative drug exporter